MGTHMASLVYAFLLFFIVFITVLQPSSCDGSHHKADPDDPHGGVPMGVSNQFCDDAKTNLSIDWDPSSTDEYTCLEEKTRPAKIGLRYFHCDKFAKRPIHKCYPEEIHYEEDLPTSGPHRPLWPKYGEYRYVPVQRWLHSLEHGAVVFLYHPCADPEQIATFKAVAKGCLKRHIISPNKKMPPDMNFALLTWQCKLVMSEANVQAMVQYVKDHALKAPERSVKNDGQYDLELIHHAQTVSDSADSELCPQMSLMKDLNDKVSDNSHRRRLKAQRSESKLSKIMENFLADMQG